MDYAPASEVGLFALSSWGGHEGSIMSDGPDSGAVERSASPASTQRLSIFQLESELAELIEFRDNEELTAEERVVVDGQIAEYIKREITKVDNLRSYMRHCGMMEAAAKEESELQANRARSWRSRLDYLKGCCLGAMQIMGKKRLEGRTGYLLAKANGGKQALTIYDAALIPESMVTYRGFMRPEAMAAIPEQVRGRQDFIFEREPMQEAIRKAMDAKCEECSGSGVYERRVVDADKVDEPCPACNGSGKQTVPGARLESRGSHVEIR